MYILFLVNIHFIYVNVKQHIIYISLSIYIYMYTYIMY